MISKQINLTQKYQIISDWKLRERRKALVSKLITACDKCGISKDEIVKEYTKRVLRGILEWRLQCSRPYVQILFIGQHLYCQLSTVHDSYGGLEIKFCST